MTDLKSANITFDALVTGELTHHAIWLEGEIDNIICDYFVGIGDRAKDFTRLFLRRDGLTFQDKIEIVRGMLPLFEAEAEVVNLKSLLNRVEDFKSSRNAMAHGRNVSKDDSELKLKIEIVTRSGKERVLEITPESHKTMTEGARTLYQELKAARNYLCGCVWKRIVIAPTTRRAKACSGRAISVSLMQGLSRPAVRARRSCPAWAAGVVMF